MFIVSYYITINKDEEEIKKNRKETHTHTPYFQQVVMFFLNNLIHKTESSEILND